MFVKSAIIKGLVKIGLAPISHLVRAEHERNQAIKERDQAVAEREDVGAGSLTSSQRRSLLRKRNAMPSENSGIRPMARSMISAENAMN